MHLIDLRRDGDEPVLACRAATGIDAAEHHVIGVGGARDAARAERLGLRLDDVVAPVGGQAELAFRRMRRVVGARTSPTATRPWADVVQSWTPSCIVLARLTSGKRAPARVAALLRPYPGGGIMRESAMAFALNEATLFCYDGHVRDSWTEIASRPRGGRLMDQNIRILQPALPGARVEEGRYAEARRRLGIKDDQLAVGLLADPPVAGLSQRFAFMMGLLYTTGHRVVGVVPACAGELARGRRFVRLHGSNWGFTMERLGLAAMLEACDVAVWDATDSRRGDGGSAGSLSIHLAMRMGVPVVAARHEVAEAALRDVPELMARDESPNGLADRLLWIASEAGLRRVMSERCVRSVARRESGEAELLKLWQEVANVPVARPGLPTPLALAGSAA